LEGSSEGQGKETIERQGEYSNSGDDRERESGKPKERRVGKAFTHHRSLLWVTIFISAVRVKALVDTGAQFTCIRRDVVNDMARQGLKVKSEPCEIVCHGVEGSKCQIRETITLRCSVGPCTTRFQFKVLDKGPYEAISGLDFLTETRMIVDAGHRKYHFASAPSERRKFESQGGLRSEPDHRVTPGVLAREVEKEQRPRGGTTRARIFIEGGNSEGLPHVILRRIGDSERNAI
jgi:hypothetical protein